MSIAGPNGKRTDILTKDLGCCEEFKSHREPLFLKNDRTISSLSRLMMRSKRVLVLTTDGWGVNYVSFK